MQDRQFMLAVGEMKLEIYNTSQSLGVVDIRELLAILGCVIHLFKIEIDQQAMQEQFLELIKDFKGDDNID